MFRTTENVSHARPTEKMQTFFMDKHTLYRPRSGGSQMIPHDSFLPVTTHDLLPSCETDLNITAGVLSSILAFSLHPLKGVSMQTHSDPWTYVSGHIFVMPRWICDQRVRLRALSCSHRAQRSEYVHSMWQTGIKCDFHSLKRKIQAKYFRIGKFT